MTVKPPNNFLGIPKPFSSYAEAKVAVLPVPFEQTVSYGAGTAKGPQAIITASAQVELYDEELGCEPYECGVATLDPLRMEGLGTSAMAKVVESAVAKVLADGKLPLILGGEHSITPPIVKAVADTHGPITVVQFDAHADLRQEYEGDPMSHACAMARVRDICPAVQIGIRNLSKEEAAWVKRDRLPLFSAHEMCASSHAGWMTDAMRAIETENVYITIDLDGFDSSLMPATGTPEPGGLSWYQVLSFVRKVCETKRVVGFDIVELAPITDLHACDFLAAKLAYKCIGYWAQARR